MCVLEDWEWSGNVPVVTVWPGGVLVTEVWPAAVVCEALLDIY